MPATGKTDTDSTVSKKLRVLGNSDNAYLSSTHSLALAAAHVSPSSPRTTPPQAGSAAKTPVSPGMPTRSPTSGPHTPDVSSPWPTTTSPTRSLSNGLHPEGALVSPALPAAINRPTPNPCTSVPVPRLFSLDARFLRLPIGRLPALLRAILQSPPPPPLHPPRGVPL